MRIKKIFSPLFPIVSMMDTYKDISKYMETNIGRGQNISFIGNEKFWKYIDSLKIFVKLTYSLKSICYQLSPEILNCTTACDCVPLPLQTLDQTDNSTGETGDWGREQRYERQRRLSQSDMWCALVPGTSQCWQRILNMCWWERGAFLEQFLEYRV